jgi:hypothetical protein
VRESPPSGFAFHASGHASWGAGSAVVIAYAIGIGDCPLPRRLVVEARRGRAPEQHGTRSSRGSAPDDFFRVRLPDHKVVLRRRGARRRRHGLGPKSCRRTGLATQRGQAEGVACPGKSADPCPQGERDQGPCCLVRTKPATPAAPWVVVPAGAASFMAETDRTLRLAREDCAVRQHRRSKRRLGSFP